MNEIKSGYHIRRNNQQISDVDYSDVKNNTYPKGIIAFIFNLIIFSLILIIGILIWDVYDDWYKGTLYKLKWYDIWLIASVFSLAYNIFWWMGRKEFLSRVRYMIHQVSLRIKLNKLKEVVDYKNTRIIKNFSTYDDFKDFIKEKISSTKIMYIVSWIFSIITLVSSLICVLVYHFK